MLTFSELAADLAGMSCVSNVVAGALPLGFKVTPWCGLQVSS